MTRILCLSDEFSFSPNSSFGDSIAVAALKSGKTSGDILALPGLAGSAEIEVDNGVKVVKRVSMVLNDVGAGEQL